VLKDDGEEVLASLIEIIGGVDLPIMDNKSSDPFVVVKFNRSLLSAPSQFSHYSAHLQSLQHELRRNRHSQRSR